MKFRNLKSLLALVLAIMVFAISVPAMAEGEITITVNNTTEKAHTYYAYQVFKGNVETISGNKVLTNIDWGTGVTATATILSELASNTTLKTGDDFDFAGAASAQDVARILNSISGSADKVKAFANIIAAHLGTAADSAALSSGSAVLDVTTPGAGYYLVKEDESSTLPTGETYTKIILEVIDSKEVNAKDTHLTPDKKIVEGANKVDANNVAIGDEVKYEITVDIPDTTEYNRYKMVMNDTMSKGLTFKEITSIKIGNDEMILATDEATSDGKITAEDLASELSLTNMYVSLGVVNTDQHKLVVTFKDFKDKAESPAGTAKTGKITIQYTAVLNEDAVIEEAGNPNTVNFEYSNNPNKDISGDKFNNEEPHGKTPDSTVITYVTELRVLKVDGTHNDNPLAGAEFKLEGTEVNIELLTGTKYVELPHTNDATETDSDVGPFYKLNDGTYTKTSPTTSGIDTSKYADSTGNTTYKLVSYEEKILTSSAADRTVWSGSDGIIEFTGLRANDSGKFYTLTEVTAPAGYNKIDPVNFTVTWTKPAAGDTTGKGGFTITSSNPTDYPIEWDATNKVWKITVRNNTGAQLPSTGGIGTTIFYVAGSILVLAAAILLITKRRMGAED